MKRREVIKTLLAATLASALPPQLAFSANHKGAGKQRRRPNIILILVDDLGYGELGSYGSRFNETPNLDRMAHEGLRFTNAYAAAPVCSPTRAAIMTGQYPARVGITDWLRGNDKHFLEPSYVTINERLKSAGYVTGLIGKWHLMGNHQKKLGAPQLQHWDEIICSETKFIAEGDYFSPYFFMPECQAPQPHEYLPYLLNNKAIDFIHRHRDDPFFLYLSRYAIHTKLAAPRDLIAKYKRKSGAGKHRNNPVLAAMLETVDDGVGRVIQTLKKLGLDNDTLIVFASDNGGETTVTKNDGLRAGKSTLYEGGIKVPLIIRAPGRVRAGAQTDVLTASHDFYPTFEQLAGVYPTDADGKPHGGQPVDGLSLVPLFNGSSRLPRDTLFWHYPLAKRHFLGGQSSGAIHQGNYKLIEFYKTGKVELYDLQTDPSESKNLAAVMPDRVELMRYELSAWRSRIGASMVPMHHEQQ